MALSNLIMSLLTTTILMVVLYLLSSLVLYRGLVPLSVALPSRKLGRQVFYLLIMPGTVIHELSHLIACKLCRVHVFEAHLFNPQPSGVVGQVIYERCDPFRRNLIAFAPFAGGSLALYFVTTVLFSQTLGARLDRLPLQSGDWFANLGLLIGAVLTTLAGADWRSPATWLFLYLVFSIGYGIAPSRTDLSHLLSDAAFALAVCVAVFFVDSILRTGLLGSGLVAELARLLGLALTRLNALLLFSGVVIGLGALVLVPTATLLRGLRRR